MSGMTTYFIRRLMFIPVIFVCITLILYTVLRLTPGGPIEQMQMAMLAAQQGEGGGGAALDAAGAEGGQKGIDPEGMRQLRKHFKLDKSIIHGYFIWLGVMPNTIEDDKRGVVIPETLPVRGRPSKDGEQVGEVKRGEELKILTRDQGYAKIGEDRWVLDLSLEPVVVGYRWSGVLQGDFGTSYTRGEPVVNVIVSRFPISIYFGLSGFIMSWVVCIPLGVYKAIYHKSHFDTATSILVFIGYSIPGFVACLVLLTWLGTHWQWVPLGGFHAPQEQWEQMGTIEKIFNQLHHTFVPMIGYMISIFAAKTILMKNSLLENFGADYVRTGFAKGLSENRVIFLHALRNSLIPITAGLGHALGLLFAGSFLIEQVCNIPGLGLLGYEALIQRDYPIILATAVFTTLIMLFGNIFSDLIWAAIDPRIRFSASS